jgi:pectinesterase
MMLPRSLELVALIGSTALLMLGAAPESTQPAKAVRIVLVGDSTVTEKSGWGLGFKKLVADDVEVINCSAGGRSSKSYRDEGKWTDALTKIQRGDYVLIQFGHNDCPGKGPERETDPKTTFRENMARYVDEARAAGGKPVLVTSLTRRKFNDDGTIRPDDLAHFAEGTRAVAADKNVPLIELYDRSVELCNQIGDEVMRGYEAPAAENKGKRDITHVNAKGSDLFARLVVDELKKAVPELAAHLR